MSATEERELIDFGWCIVELFGHRKLGAQCREVPVAGGVMLRCDIPGSEGVEPFTQFYGASALFCVSPCSEVAARAIAARYTQPPIRRYEMPALRAPEPDQAVRFSGTDAEGTTVYHSGWIGEPEDEKEF